MAKQAEAFEERNARLVVIGNGAPHFMTAFREDTGYKGNLYTDPSLETYKILDLKRGVGSLFGLKSLKEGIRAASSGYLQTEIQGDALQQGGAIIIGPGDILHYSYQNKEVGDHPPIKEMLKVAGA
ncbi:Peroxiredoxin-like domain-containing protein [Desulfonema magnum]|uniref:Peroxiredoxin-like domain-containing protein n=1 Tax=Desulfonema magnum TaxID=45655 RepID=A0A975GKL9_9BACT|nr:Peroxiredoxin-like domain-containing protein [Desulfonema magnum]